MDHLSVLREVRQLALSRDPETAGDALEYMTHHSPSIPPEVIEALGIWRLLFDSPHEEVSAIAEISANQALPTDIVTLLSDTRL